jgi:hypothetical protein
MNGIFDFRFSIFDCLRRRLKPRHGGVGSGNRQSAIGNRQWVGWFLAVVVGLGLAGCGEDLGPSPGVVEGDDTLSGRANALVPYDIHASGTTHEAFSLYVDGALDAWIKGRPPLGGVQQGYGTVAPLEGYEDLAAAAAGYTYFYVTADGEHYGKLEALELTQDHQQGVVSLTFHWWLQTRGDERDIGG